jgi:proline dehydrogenase
VLQSLLFPLAARFVAGDSIPDAICAVRRLNENGLKASIDILGEDVKSARDADAARDGYLSLIEAIRGEGLSTNLSLKLSVLGLSLGDTGTAGRYESILEGARALPDPFVRVDMEGSRLVNSTLEMVAGAFGHYKNTGPVLQAALYRTQRDVETMTRFGMRVRLCKGAYRESAQVAMRGTAAVRANFMTCAVALLRGAPLPAFATHDPYLIDGLRRYTDENGIPKSAFEFQMLYGVRPDLQDVLVRAGYAVRIYVPFGSHWAKYFRRRVLERRENLVFALRSAFNVQVGER